ncbi:hypothetical protein JCM6882_003723 [Rhodosporidiobolus microsporus]
MPRNLPPELWQLIFRHALPARLIRRSVWTGSTWKEHAATLRAFSLVSSTWRALAQPLLFEQAFVADETIGSFAEALATSPPLADAVRVLKVFRQSTRDALEAILRRLPQLRELHLSQVREFDLSLLRNTPELVKLGGWSLELVFHCANLRFALPSLTEISFSGTTFWPSVVDFFTPSYLPNLRAAAICYPRTSAGAETSTTASHLLDAFPASLFVLATWNPRTGLPPADTALHTVYTLREEALDWSETSLGTRCGSYPIRHLSLHDVPDGPETALCPVLEDDPALEQLETLYIARSPASDGATDNLAPYLEFGRQQGVEVVFVTESEFMEESMLDPVMLRRHVGEVGG